mgnify:CR=1 FL=1
MARLARICPSGIAQHIIQRGNNRQPCFASEHDFCNYAHWLKEYAAQFSVDIHAWVFMSNHVHLLATPHQADAISLMMQAIGRRYVRFFNKQYQRTGTLWEGRFKSCLIQSDRYLLQCYRYIELNPVRAAMVADPADYVWSSYQCNALGKTSDLCTPHPEYLALAKDDKQRLAVYRSLFQQRINKSLIEDISAATNKGLALGNQKFKQEIEALCNRRVTAKKAGRPKGG